MTEPAKPEITPAEADAEFAELLDNLGAEAVADGDYEMAGYLFDASDWHQLPPESRISARLMLLAAAVGRKAADR